ncbi:hypothetical protein TorRG33x02_036240 [Trema orientale]|uniref:Uncharacterized protein n=1 Tax=Trema orientale TaxID=63057 RepID=A0A2P5FRZ1_TREOI|nr:hypothetical protein TorRG33x02_036240 [Trema orientale]
MALGTDGFNEALVTTRGSFVNIVRGSEFLEIGLDDLVVEFFESSGDRGCSSSRNSDVSLASGSSAPHKRGSKGDHDEEWRHSVAPIPAEELTEATDDVDDEMEIALDNGILPPLGDLNLVLEDDNNKVVGDELIDFDIENASVQKQ